MMYWMLARLFNQTESVEQLNATQQQALESFKRKIANNEYSFEDVPCLCGEGEGILIGTRDRYGLEVHTHLCEHCGVMWTSPRMTEDSLKKFYEDDYRSIYVGEPRAPESFFKEQVNHGERIYNFVKPHTLWWDKKSLKAFDIGCGAGGALIPFKRNGWLTFGCDLGEEYLNRGKEEGLVLECGEATSLSRYGPADLVILSHVLEHFSHPIKSLNEISKLLTDDGYLYVEVPGIFKVHSSYGDFLLFLQNAHLYHFTLSTLSSVMNLAGFKLIGGNEQICALFQKKREIEIQKEKSPSSKIRSYIYLTEIYHRLYIDEIVFSSKKSAVWSYYHIRDWIRAHS
ncbi:class I SAM-dependent methyltransferase [Methanoculleus sp.]|nr:class I SAM-dependent methyltransferase [Methanoculleus sp.]